MEVKHSTVNLELLLKRRTLTPIMIKLQFVQSKGSDWTNCSPFGWKYQIWSKDVKWLLTPTAPYTVATAFTFIHYKPNLCNIKMATLTLASSSENITINPLAPNIRYTCHTEQCSKYHTMGTAFIMQHPFQFQSALHHTGHLILSPKG